MRFGTQEQLLLIGGSHIYKKGFALLLSKYDIKYRVAIPDLTEIGGQVDASIGEIRNILSKIVNVNRMDLSTKLEYVL